MRQVLQPVSGGPVEVAEVPKPTIEPTKVLVRTVASVISPCTGTGRQHSCPCDRADRSGLLPLPARPTAALPLLVADRRLRPPRAGGAAVRTPTGEPGVTVTGLAPLWLEIEAAPIATGLLRTTVASVLTYRLDTILPVRLSTSWRRADDLPGSRRPA